MSTRIQDALSSCCNGIKEFGSAATEWLGKTVTTLTTFIAENAKRVADCVKPHFEHLKAFAQDNKESIIVAGVAFTIGAVVTAIISNVFYRSTNTPDPAST